MPVIGEGTRCKRRKADRRAQNLKGIGCRRTFVVCCPRDRRRHSITARLGRDGIAAVCNPCIGLPRIGVCDRTRAEICRERGQICRGSIRPVLERDRCLVLRLHDLPGDGGDSAVDGDPAALVRRSPLVVIGISQREGGVISADVDTLFPVQVAVEGHEVLFVSCRGGLRFTGVSKLGTRQCGDGERLFFNDKAARTAVAVRAVEVLEVIHAREAHGPCVFTRVFGQRGAVIASRVSIIKRDFCPDTITRRIEPRDRGVRRQGDTVVLRQCRRFTILPALGELDLNPRDRRFFYLEMIGDADDLIADSFNVLLGNRRAPELITFFYRKLDSITARLCFFDRDRTILFRPCLF